MLSAHKCMAPLVLLLVFFTSSPVYGLIQGGDAPKAVPVERVVLKFQDGIYELLSRVELKKILPPSEELPATDNLVRGFWYELRSSQNEVLYRRIIIDPVTVVFEGPDTESPSRSGEKESGGLVRHEVVPRERVFTLLIPRPGPGDQLVLFGEPLQPTPQGAESMQAEARTAQPAVELARFTLVPLNEKDGGAP